MEKSLHFSKELNPFINCVYCVVNMTFLHPSHTNKNSVDILLNNKNHRKIIKSKSAAKQNSYFYSIEKEMNSKQQRTFFCLFLLNTRSLLMLFHLILVS